MSSRHSGTALPEIDFTALEREVYATGLLHPATVVALLQRLRTVEAENKRLWENLHGEQAESRRELEMREGEIGSLNLWLSLLLDAIKNVRYVFRNLDNTLFETDEGDIRQRELSHYEKDALSALYAAMNEVK